MQIVRPIQWKKQDINKNICYIKINNQNKIDQPESEDTSQIDQEDDVTQFAKYSHRKDQVCIPHNYGTNKIVISAIQPQISQKHSPLSIELQIFHLKSDSQDVALYFPCYAERFLAFVQYHAPFPEPSNKRSHTIGVY